LSVVEYIYHSKMFFVPFEIQKGYQRRDEGSLYGFQKEEKEKCTYTKRMYKISTKSRGRVKVTEGTEEEKNNII